MEEAIVISQPKNFPSIFLNEFVKKLNKPDFKVKIIKTEEPGMMAGIEWALPTLVIAYLSKPFFQSFFQEAGKDFYKLCKLELKKFILKNREIKAKYLSASQSIDKLSKKYDQSITISLKAKFEDSLMITVLFNETIPENEADQMLERMFETLLSVYEESQKQEPADTHRNGRMNQVYLIANNRANKWEILTQQQMFERYRN